MISEPRQSPPLHTGLAPAIEAGVDHLEHFAEGGQVAVVGPQAPTQLPNALYGGELRTQRRKDSDTVGFNIVPPVFVGKWTVKIVNLLKHRPHRHGELRRNLQTASQRMLTRTLRNLEATGLIERHVAQMKPLVVEYSLTKLGRTFLVPMDSLCRWAKRHQRQLSRCRAQLSGDR